MTSKLRLRQRLELSYYLIVERRLLGSGLMAHLPIRP